MKEHFTNELHRLLLQIQTQGTLVHHSIQQALTAFQTADEQLARQIIAHDSVIDCEEIRLEEECLKILALYQPVATDLRVVISCIKMNISLERMADFACHIAERAIHRAAASTPQPSASCDFTTMSQLVLSMLQDTLGLIVSADIALAHTVIAKDDAVDSLRNQHKTAARKALEGTPSDAGYFIDCLGLARDLERIADLCIDICQQILYLRTGHIVRHHIS